MQYAGEVTISDPGSDVPLFSGGTISCCHCGSHWLPRPGSGITRAFCQNCNGYVCSEECAKKCVPVEVYLESLEKGRPADYRPVIVPTSL